MAFGAPPSVARLAHPRMQPIPATLEAGSLPWCLRALRVLLVELLALLDERPQLVADLGGDALEIPFAEGDQAHWRGGDDVCHASAAGKHPHLPKDVARSQRPDDLAALDHVGGAGVDDDQVVGVVAF